MNIQKGFEKSQPTTIRDVAEAAAVSTATVSRAFNHPDRVRASTRACIFDAAERLNFVPNAWASSLSSQRTKIIGVVIPTIDYAIYSETTHAIQEAAEDLDYSVMISSSEWSPLVEAKRIRKFIEQRVDGLILIGADRFSDIYDSLRRHNVPFVIVWTLARDSGLPCVAFDNCKASAVAVDHLTALGHRRIALMHGDISITDRGRQRKEGFLKRMGDYGLTVGAPYVMECRLEFEDAQAAMEELLALAPPPTAVLAANDVLAVGAMKACEKFGLKVPDDISVVGCDNMVFGQFTSPGLTTIRIPAVEMGNRAVRQIVASIEGQLRSRSVELPVELVVRGSTGPVKPV